MRYAQPLLSERQVEILHVDDSPQMTSVTADCLEQQRERFEVWTANSAADGLALLEDRRFDCVVSDYEMPDRTGVEFLRSVRERNEELPFILFTGKGSEEVASEAISAGVTDYLQKGSGLEQYEVLSNRIENAVGRDRATHHLELLIDNLPGIVYQHLDEPSWPLVLIAGDCEELFGYTARELQQDVHLAEEAIHSDDLAYHNQTLQNELEAHGQYELIYRVVGRDDDVRWVIDSGQKHHSPRHDCQLFSGVLIDITDLTDGDGGFEATPDRLD